MGPDGELGSTELVTHHIDTQGAAPIKSRYRPPGHAMRKAVDESLDKMLELGVIKPTVSPWSSPIVLVKKKDGSIRFCVDLRQVNAVTKKDAYPLPNINDCLGSLSGSEFFCTLDLASGYWQVAVAPDDIEKTAFSTHRGQFAFTRMPFGLTNAPATFMRLMEMTLRGLEWERCLVYLDDVVVFGSDFSTCLQNLTEVFQRFEDAGLKLKPSKCNLFQKEVAFLGHRVNKEGVSCDPAKLEAVRDWPRPENVAEVRSFLGLANYYKRFVPDFSKVALPLTTLTHKAVAFCWDQKCEDSFNTLKGLLTNAPTLGYPSPDPDAQFILDTDASEYAMGAVLSQIQGGEERVLAYASKALQPSERNYCTTYRELLAIVTFVPHFKHYLLGRKFKVRTDHSSLRWFHNFKNAEGMVGRWHAILANFDYEIVYREGSAHGNADAMSRHPAILRKRRCGTTLCTECQGATPTPIRVCSVLTTPKGQTYRYLHWQPRRTCPVAEPEGGEDGFTRPVYVRPVQAGQSNWLPSWGVEELREWQQRDPAIAVVYSWVAEQQRPTKQELGIQGPLAKNLCGLWDTLVIREGLLYRRWETSVFGETHQLVAPPEIRAEIFRQLHTVRQGGHFGLRRTVAVVRERFFWPGVKADVERWCRECEACQRAKSKPKRQGLMQQEPVGGRFERVAIDIMGELPVTENGNKYILVISDYFTKWTQAFPIPNQTAATVADTLVTNCFSLFGVPRWLHSDQGTNFESELFQELCKLLDIHKTRTLAYHPQSDGQVERFNRTCKQMLKTFVNENMTDWDDHLPLLLMAYRATPHESTGLSPNLMMFGDECALPLDVMVKAPPRQRHVCRTEYVEWLRQSLVKGHELARRHLKVAAKRQKRYYDSKARPHKYRVGSFVWHWYDPAAAKKFGCGWTGPYRVVDCPTETHCLIQKAPGEPTRRVHVNKLKPHIGRLPPAWDDNDPLPPQPPPPPPLPLPHEAPMTERSSDSDSESGDDTLPVPLAGNCPPCAEPPSLISPPPQSPVPATYLRPGKRAVRRPQRLDL